MTTNLIRQWALAAMFVGGLGLAGYGLGAHDVQKANKLTGEQLDAVRYVCKDYYAWREQRSQDQWSPSIDKICFETQEMVP